EVEALEEERVALRGHEIEGGPRDRGEPVATVGAGSVVGQPQEGLGEQMAGEGQSLPIEVPPLEALCLEKSGRHHHGVTLVRLAQKLRDMAGRVREVTVHGDELVVALFVRVGDARVMGAADSHLPRAMDHLHPRLLGAQTIEDLAGAVGGVVVDEQQVEIDAEVQDLTTKALSVLLLVIGGYENQWA